MRQGIGDFRRIALIGAGGKTTLSEALALAFAEAEARVALTTSTRILLPDALPALIAPTEREISDAWARANPIAVCGADYGVDERTGRRKMRAPCDKTISFLFENASRLIIEADGARGRLLKLHGENEPVIPAETDLVLIVASMRALGQPLGEVCHRVERILPVLGKAVTDRADAGDIAAAIAAAKCGACKNKRAILNRVTAETCAEAERISARLLSQYGMEALLLPDLPDEKTRRQTLAKLLLK